MDYLRGIIGLLVLIGFAYLFSVNKKKIDWRLVVTGLGLQVIFGFLITQVPFVEMIFMKVLRLLSKNIEIKSRVTAFKVSNSREQPTICKRRTRTNVDLTKQLRAIDIFYFPENCTQRF